MRRTTVLHGATACVLCSLAWAAQVQAQGAGAQGAEDEAGGPPQVHLGGVKMPARVGGGGTARAPTAVGLGAGGVTVPGAAGTRAALVAQAVRAGLVTWQEAWQSGQMGRAEVLELLAEWPLRSRVVAGTSHAEGVEVRRQLGALLVGDLKGEADLEATQKWSAGARLVLATALVEAGDARAVELLEELWRERPLAERGPYTFFIIEQLAHFYSNQREYEKAAQTWLRMTQVEPRNAKQTWWKPDALLQAARLYVQTDQIEKARALYAQVPQYGQERFTEVAAYDQAAIEMRKGNSAQARQLLLQLALTTSPTSQPGISSVMAHSYYVDGEFAEARQLFMQIAGQTKTIGGSSDARDEVAVRVDRAKEHLRLIEQWMQTPLVCEPSQLSVRASSLGEEPVTRWLYVSSFRDVAVKVESNNPLITVKEGQKQWEDDEQLQYNQEFEVTVAAEARQSTASWLTVTSARFPTVHLQVPVQFTTLKGGDQIGTFSEKTP